MRSNNSRKRTVMTKNKSKFVLTVIFVLVFALFLSSCSFFSIPEDENRGDDGKQDEPEKEKTELTIAYFSGEKIDPYTAKNRANRAVIGLCYDGLVFLDGDKKATGDIATFETDGSTATFVIKDGARFSDGSAVTADDVLYSFDRAKADGSIYAFRFSKYISSWKKTSANTVTVTFKTKNIYNVNLFDFPIIRKNSQGAYPDGTGNYRISSKDALLYLELNDNSEKADGSEIKIIKLTQITDAQDLNYNFNYGVIHAAYADLSDGSQRYKGNVELVTFMTNSLVYAVVNKSKGYLSSSGVSSAISLALDRKKISADILDSLGDCVWQPFNLNWCELKNKDIKKDIYSSSEAHLLFEANGLTLRGRKRTHYGKELSLTVICNNEDRTRVRIANAVADGLKEAGFSADVVLYNWNDYQKAINAGNYDIYIAETHIPDNFDIRYMFTDGAVNTHSGVPSAFLAALDGFYAGDVDAAALLSAFNADMPFIPLYYNRGALAVNRLVSGDFKPTEADIFNGIENWTISE